MSTFAKMIVTYKGKKYEYLINTEVSNLQIDKAVESILRDYPPDIPINWEDNPKIVSRNTLQDLINTNNENKYN